MNSFRCFNVFSLFFCSVLPMLGIAEEFKLSNDIIPSSQVIELNLDPNLGNYSGTTTIDINIVKPTSIVKIYSKNLSITTVVIANGNNNKKLAVIGTNKYNITSLLAKNIIPKGKYQISLSFKGAYTKTGSGLFKVTEGNETYLFTQFQAMLARSVFPSFDQPNFKIPFQFKISVPKGYAALSNTPQMQQSKHGDWNTFVFEPTAPIYSDVLAFAVGNFDSIEIPNMPVPSRLYVVKGKQAQAKYAIKHIGNIFKEVETFFSMKYPYKKLDMVAVPNYANAAMENVGLIYFKEDFILLNETPSIHQQKNILKLIAHEISHMWFGNLVTMQWWNDLWLNESFSEWLARKIVIATFPELSANLDLPQIRSLADDNVNTQLPIRRMVKSKADADSMGAIVYDKGNAILNMVEHYVGEENFRQAVITYLLEYKNINATLQNFVKHIEEVSEKDLSGFFSSFLEQPGFPLISLKVDDERLLISQQPFGASDQDKKKMLWQVPLMFKFLTDKAAITKSVFLNKHTMEIPLPKGVKAVFPDAKAVGYYRYLLSDKDESFIKNNISRLDDDEKLSWLDNNIQLTKISKRAYADVLSVKLALLSDLSLNNKVASDIIRDIDFSYTDFIPETIQEEYSRYLATHLNERLKSVEWHDISDDTIAESSLKANLLSLAGGRLRNRSAIEFAEKNYMNILSEQTSLDASIASAVLKVIAANNSKKEYLLFKKAYLSTTNSHLKSNILTAMGYFPSQDIVNRYYDFLLSGQVPTDEIGYRFQYPAFNPALRRHVIDYIDANKDKILKHINQQQWFPYNFYTSCEENIRVRVNQVFSTWAKDVPGLREKLNTVNETIKQCINSRAKNILQLKKLLSK